jgi:Rieske Fe-S protein
LAAKIGNRETVDMDVTNEDSGATTRRAMLAGAGAAGVAATLAACGTDSGTGSGSGMAPTSAAPAGGAPASSAAGNAANAIKTAEIPVNGGRIYQDQNVVVTQPTAGKFEAFSATCPHAGCTVNKVADNVISCPCHGSKFSAKDGSVTHGPATKGLTKKAVTLAGDSITIA